VSSHQLPAEDGDLHELRSSRVYTPRAIANAMVACVADSRAESWLDPCIGEGAFTEAMLTAKVPAERIVGIDLVQTSFAAPTGIAVKTGVDFIHWAESCGRKFSRIIANPPYLSLSRLPAHLRRRATAVTIDGTRRVPLGANYWVAFLAQAAKLLEDGGHLCFVLPASWEYADYATFIREYLPGQFDTFDVHRSITPLFPKVQEGSIVIVGRGYHRVHRTRRYFEHRSAVELCRALVDAAAVPRTSVSATKGRSLTVESEMVSLGSVLEVSIGAVTGDASYFLLSEERRRQLALPIRALRPVLTHSRHLTAGIIGEREWRRLRDAGERVWLFRPREGLLKHMGVRAYLELDVSEDGCNQGSYKVSIRKPWHRVQLPSHPDGFLSGMSRLGPWIALKGMSNLTATNTLYCARFSKRLGDSEKAAWCLALISSVAREQLAPLGRRYPDGLLKFEPRDLASVLLPRPGSSVGARPAYRQAVKSLLAGAVADAQRIADQWLESCTPVSPQTSSSRQIARKQVG
jgi:methylase of polypeptide subunit release factors